MAYPARLLSLIGIAVILSVGVHAPAKAQTAITQDAALRAVRLFYAFHLAHNKGFTARNVQLRKRFLTGELYRLLLKELKRQAAETKAHPDEVPDFDGDPFTDSQEYPDSYRVGKAETDGDLAKVTVTLLWSARTSRGRDKRNIVVEVTRSGAGWLINDIINNEGSRLRDELKRER
jgi:hypothetical protein